MFEIAFRADDMPWFTCSHCRRLSNMRATAAECPTCERPVCDECRRRRSACPDAAAVPGEELSDD